MRAEKIPVTRKQWTVVLIGQAAVIVTLVVLVILFYQLSLVCPGRSAYPHFDTVVSPSPDGYEIDVVGVSEVHALEKYQVSILKNGERWGGLPVQLERGPLGRGPIGEYLNFTDLNSDGNLTRGDWFTLENLEAGTEYELVLFWAECSKRLVTVGISVP